jgi:uncharacterized protein YbaR (Trm112 family)
MIIVCPACKKAYPQVPDSIAARRLRCTDRNCGVPFVVCPACKQAHQALNLVVGQRFQCLDPNCGVTFEIRPDMPKPPQPPDDSNIGRSKTEVSPDKMGGGSGPLPVQRPFGLVWVVFYWVIWGVGCLVMGYMLATMGGVMGGVRSMTQDMFGSGGFRGPGRESALATVLLEFAGLLIFHVGLLTIVTCYGLWTSRKWGLSLARGLAIAYVVLNLIGFVVSLVSRTGIVMCLVGLAISGGILFYLYGKAGLRNRLQQSLGNRLEGGNWHEFR